MIGKTREIGGLAVPTFLYGTAWKDERTSDLVSKALRAGFRGIDTANQRRHYFEAGVGQVLKAAIEAGTVKRKDVFVQTKFTFRPSQDHRLPYDPAAPIGQQVAQSFESSLSHLGSDRIDSYLLHGPSERWGLDPADLEAWMAMESLHDNGKVSLLGVSNFSSDQLQALMIRARVRPAFVQNRCYASVGWDAAVRALCEAEGIVYQAFSLLTANLQIIRAPVLQQIVRRHRRTPAQVVFRFALQAGMIPLTGTTDPAHMADDLAVYEFELTDHEVQAIEGIAL